MELVQMLSFEEVVALGLVLNEMAGAKEQHPDWPDDQVHAAAIVAEEAGELVRASLNARYHGQRQQHCTDEAMQTAATALRFMANAPIEGPNGILVR